MEPRLTQDYLQPGEVILRQEGRNLRSIIDGVVWTFLALVGALIGLFLAAQLTIRQLQPLWWTLSAGVIVGYVVFAILRYRRAVTSRYVITPERVYRAHGILRFFLAQTTYDKVTDIHIYQSFFGRIWNFGTVRLETAGFGIRLEGVPDPFGVKQSVEAARAAFFERLVETYQKERKGKKAVASAAAGPLPLTGPARALAPEWNGRPAFASMTPTFITLAAGTLGLLVLGLGAMFVATELTLVFWFGLAFLLLIAALQAIEYGYTRYEATSMGVTVSKGWLSRHRVETTYDKVTDVTTYQSLLGRLLDFGQITINTAGSAEAPVVFKGVKDPLAVKRILDDARERRRRTA